MLTTVWTRLVCPTKSTSVLSTTSLRLLDSPPLLLDLRVLVSMCLFMVRTGIISLISCPLCVSLLSLLSSVYTLARVFGVEGELSGIARQGSGSACRSMYGGFVQWIMGHESDGKDSVAQQVAPETHWPDLRILVLVVRLKVTKWSVLCREQTAVHSVVLVWTIISCVWRRLCFRPALSGSRSAARLGCKRACKQVAYWRSNVTPFCQHSAHLWHPFSTPRHSSGNRRLLCVQHRAQSVVPHRMAEMIDAVRRKDFSAFAELTMKDSNQFHATCLDTYPPIFYLSSVSQRVISVVHRYNRHYGETRVSSASVWYAGLMHWKGDFTVFVCVCVSVAGLTCVWCSVL